MKKVAHAKTLKNKICLLQNKKDAEAVKEEVHP